MNPLIKKLKEYGFISPKIEAELNNKIKCQTRAKGDFFLKQGQSVSSLFLLESGLVRSYYSNENREINSWFGFENIILVSILTLFCNLPSHENIQFLDASTVYYIDNKDLNDLYNKYNEMNTIGRIMTEEYCQILEERIISLQTQSAEERYKSLLKYQPNATQRIALGHIASYLGIKQETISRIRKK